VSGASRGQQVISEVKIAFTPKPQKASPHIIGKERCKQQCSLFNPVHRPRNGGYIFSELSILTKEGEHWPGGASESHSRNSRVSCS
jgi:hypothetical protein